MELGEKLRQARLKAGLSQRQLCGGEITRNMLSQIEHGSCNPSVSTLCFLAKQLGLPVSYFLEEETVASSNGSTMSAAWANFEAGDAAGAMGALEAYRGPDPVYDREYTLLKALVLLRLVSESMEAGRQIYAGKLLNQVRELEEQLPWFPELTRRRTALQARLSQTVPESQLPCLDEELMLHAASALAGKRPRRAAALLEACENQEEAGWKLLRGRAHFALEEYGAAARLLQQVEQTEPSAIPLLEQCFSALGDYQLAYYYACKQRR